MEDVEHVVSAMATDIFPYQLLGGACPLGPSLPHMVVYGASPMALPYWSHNGYLMSGGVDVADFSSPSNNIWIGTVSTSPPVIQAFYRSRNAW
jgi:hypothetical protein